jgi:hypothetical protein
VVANTTTRLGDWYANLLRIGRLQLVLAISERTFFPVVVAAMIDFAKGLEFYLEGEPSLLGLSLKLAETLCSPLYKTETSPDRAALASFATP